MKPFSVHSGSCSCTSCVYRSRSKEPKVQQIIQGGTEIDKLYYGKFLPLRERNLLEKLIRTRDVYNDARNQLLSSSNSDQISLDHKRKRRDYVSTEKSSAVLKMGNLVDRSQMGSANTNKFSSCCSCCSCETLRKIRKRMEKDKHKHPRVHRHIVTCEDIAKYCAEAEERGRKRRNKLSTKISSKVGAARLKMKKNLSEPCACTLSLSSMATSSSKALKKMRSKKKAKESAQARKVVTIDQETKITKLPRKLRKIEKNIQSSTTKDSGTEMRSLKAFKIKKDSIILFKEKLLKKRTYEENQDVECEPGTCDEDECIPEECLKKIKAKGVGDTKKRKYHTQHSDTGRDKYHISMSSRTKKVKVRDSQVQDGPSSKFSQSMTTILKTKVTPSLSKSAIKGKRPVSRKQRQQFEKGTRKQEKAYERTKSTSSMTTVPKSKAKAQLAIKEEKVAPKVKPKAKLQVTAKDKRLEEKGIRVQVSPQSNLATCECKLSTKSTSSSTSAPKQKTSKYSKRIKSHEVASPPTRHKRGRQRPIRESYQSVESADLEEPIAHVKAKREKRMKPTHGRIEQRRKHKHSNTQFTGTLSKASQESYLRDSASQANDLPFPRECEPLMCIPYECDPEKCAQILRSISRGKSAMTSTDRLRRKSVGSAAFSQKTSQKTSSRSRTKSKHKQSKSAENFIRKPKYISKEPTPQIMEKCSPDRQAVKITSSFSFNIEFYKDTCPYVKDNSKKDLVSGHQKKIKQKEHRRKYKDHGTGYTSSQQNISSQSRSSQSFKNIQVGHRLKRCFCTLKLLPNKEQKLKHAVSKRTMASFHNKELDMRHRKKRTQTESPGIAYVVPPATSTPAPLLPYECEPFCTPGECNPNECAERIRQRNRRAARHISKDTNTSVITKKLHYIKLASTSQAVSKSTSRPNTVSGDKLERHEKRKIKHKRTHSPSSNLERTVSGDKSERQAVRISSNFNFNIECSKTNINDQEYADALKCDNKSIQRERRHLHEKGIRVYKPHVHHETSETSKYVKTKQTYTEPFLQRCLCTLKLLKKNKKKVETRSPWQNRNEYVMHMQKKSITTNRAEIRYNPERSKLLPYEWDPGLYIHKECHPYNSENLIKLRHMILQHKHSNIFSGDLGSRSIFSKTSKTVICKSRNTQSFTKECPQNPIKVKKRNQNYNEMNIMPIRSKQRVMRIGTKPSLKMSHYKSKDNCITTEHLINKRIHNKGKLNTEGSQQFKCPAHHTSKDTEAKCKESGSYVFSAIKKCFSTLKFQKKRNKEVLENKNNIISENIKTSYPLPNSQILEYKSTRTRLNKLPYGLSSCKCTPNLCMPGMCDPYERYEESKWREIKGLLDNYVSTERRDRKSVTSDTSDFSGTMAKSTQYRLRHKTKKLQKVRDTQRDIKGARSFSRSRQAPSKGSYFSSNKEISKYRFVPSIRDTTIKNRVAMYKTVSEISTVSRMPDKGTKNKRFALKDDLSQVNEIRKEVKVSNVGFLLKRCFCTLGLQKKNKSKPECHWNQPITTQFVQVEQNRHDITKSGCKVLNKTLYGEEPLKFKLPEGDNLFRKNLIGNQSAKIFPNSRSFSRRPHVRSRIEFNFDKMRGLRKIQKANPFYRSFYALNVKVSKSKNNSHNKYDECPPNECDPDDCSKKVKQLLKHSQDSQKKGTNKPNTLGSGFGIKAGVYKDTDPYKSSRKQAIRLGSDLRLNFEFFKERPSHRLSRTEDIPNHDRKKARRSHPRETQSLIAGVSNMIHKCLCTSKLKNATKSDINQNRDVTRKVKEKPRYKSTTRLSHRREKKERCLKAKSVQDKDYSKQQRRKSRRPIDKNNVKFCTNVNCVEFDNVRRGEGDVGKRKKGPIAEKKTVIDKCLCALKPKKDKKRKINKFIDKCYCTLKHLKRQSMEMIGKEKKKCKQLDKAEREMETIMPYSKNKFKKLDSQSKLTQGANQNTKQNQEGVCDYCQLPCQLNKPDSKKKKKKLDDKLKLAQATNQNTKQNQEGVCIYCQQPCQVNKSDSNKKKVCAICEMQCQPSKPDSKKKNKKLDDKLKLAQATNQNTKQNQEGVCIYCQQPCQVNKSDSNKKRVCDICKVQCQPIKSDSKKKNKKLDGELKLAQQLVCDYCKLPCQPSKPDSNKKRVCDICKVQCQPIKSDSKKKNKKLDGELKLAQQLVCGYCKLPCQPSKSDSNKKRVCDICKVQCQPIKSDSKKKNKKLDGELKLAQQLVCEYCKLPCQPSKPDSNKKRVCDICKVQCQPIKSDSKKKNKKLDSELKLAQQLVCDYCKLPCQPSKPDSNKKRVCDICKVQCQPIKSDSKKKNKKLDGELKLAQQLVCDYCKLPCQPSKPDSNKKRVCDICKVQCQPIKSDSKKKNKKLDGELKLAQQLVCDYCKLPCQPSKPDSNKKRVCDICKVQCQPIKSDSKKKNKKLDGELKLAQQLVCDYCKLPCQPSKPDSNKKRVCDICKVQCQPIKSDSKKKNKKLDGELKLAQQLVCDYCKLPCQPIKPDSNKKSVCDICKVLCQPFKRDSNKKRVCDICKVQCQPIKENPKTKKQKPSAVDKTPLFGVTVNTNNMKVVNRDEVLKNLGSSGKKSKAMKKAETAIKKGNVDPPVMEMIIDRGTANVANSRQVINQINYPETMKKDKRIKAENKTKPPESASTSQTKKLAKSHGSKCKCCICLGKKGKKAQFSTDRIKLRPCICGSVICKKDWDKIYRDQKTRAAVKLKKCICGSSVCAEESSKMPELLLEGAKQEYRNKEKAKQAKIKEKLYQKARKKRAKQQKKAFKKLVKQRRKEDKRSMQSIKKAKQHSDYGYIAESLIDLGTFGSKAFCDIARTVCRAVRYPRDTMYNVQDAVRDPAGTVMDLQEKVDGMGLFATLSRIVQRVMRMPAGKRAVAKLESHPATNYLVHMADKDPKKRMKKFPKEKKHKREPLDFECSLYMASMRKRPCLKVYYMCPWFYPHFMSLVNVWKQFTDVLLFLLAVLVWSPCILCMELCRGFVCCGLCQG